MTLPFALQIMMWRREQNVVLQTETQYNYNEVSFIL
jgi:hypothetical protein